MGFKYHFPGSGTSADSDYTVRAVLKKNSIFSKKVNPNALTLFVYLRYLINPFFFTSDNRHPPYS